MATVYLPDGSTYDDGRSDAPTFSTMPVPNTPQPLWPNANMDPSTPSGAINTRNPTQDPAKPFVQAGNTGGFLEGVGTTIGAGRSITPEAAAQFRAEALGGGVPDDWISDFLTRNSGDYNRILEGYRSEQTGSGRDAQGGGGGSQAGGGTFRPGATMFDDPGTSQLEQLLNRQLEALNQPNPQLTQLMNFLNTRFGELSNSQGYSPEELAILRTQALEPIEQYRQATKRRNTERTAARGILPSSGIADLQEGPSGLEPLDLAFDRMRVAADRDLAINSINERTNRLNQALQLGRAAFDIPTQDERTRFGDQLTRSTLLNELPRQSLMDALAVLNGTPGPESLFNQAVQLQGLSQQQDLLNQQRNAQVWSSIGSILGGLF